jgi:hypothetical protein
MCRYGIEKQPPAHYIRNVTWLYNSSGFAIDAVSSNLPIGASENG